MLKNTFLSIASLLFLFGTFVSAQDVVLSSNIVDGYDSTSFVTSVGAVSTNNNITNLIPGQRFNSGPGGAVSGLETILGRRSLNDPLMVSIHESIGNLPGTILGSISFPAASVTEYDFRDTPITRFDFTSLDLTLAPDTDYFVSFSSAPSNGVSGNYTMRVIAPTSPHGQDYVNSRNGGLSWNLPPSFLETGELPLTVFASPSDEIVLTPTVDALGELTNGVYEIQEGGSLLVTQLVDFIDLDRRPILEFTLPEIEDGRRIVSAELELDVGSGPQTPSNGELTIAQIYGYVGDNVITSEDALRTDLLVGTMGPVMGLGEVADSIDANWLNRLVNEGTTEIGLLLVMETNNSFGFYSTEGFIADVRAAPKLTLTLQSFVPGDVNQDGGVNFLDVGPFISILSANDYLAEADINEDGIVDFLDVFPFIRILTGN